MEGGRNNPSDVVVASPRTGALCAHRSAKDVLGNETISNGVVTTSQRRFKSIVQYDGTAFSGFQRQKDERTVQFVLESSLAQLMGHPVTLKASGRTDAGVHARGQVISFTTSSTIPALKLPQAISTYLPDDIVLGHTEEVSMEFDPQMDSVGKTYCYRIWRTDRHDILWKRYSHHFPWKLDFGLMEDEAAAIVGKHDFLSFRAEGSSAKTTERIVTKVSWTRWGYDDQMWEFWISADGFLYKMVRLLVGTLLDVGRGHLPPGTIASALHVPGSVKIGTCAPSKGLCLEEVKY